VAYLLFFAPFRSFLIPLLSVLKMVSLTTTNNLRSTYYWISYTEIQAFCA